MRLILFLVIALFTRCTTYYLTTESLAAQLRQSKNLEGPPKYGTLITYTSNNLDKIKGTDKNGHEYWITLDMTSHIVLIKKSGGKTYGYFDTAILRGDTLHTIESRISGGRNKILLNEIERVEIKRSYVETKNNLH